MTKKTLALFLILCLLIPTTTSYVAAEEDRQWQDEMIYFLMVDRFANGDRSNDYEADVGDLTTYQGGDFQGIIDNLDQIQSMGFTTIWLTPVVNNEKGGYHGYWTEDFYETEENFGTMEEFKTLVQEAHDRGMKVILDFVVNHTGPNNPWVNDPEKADWFNEDQPIYDEDDIEQRENGWLFGLPDLAQENPEVAQYLIDAAKFWIEETDIDGMRLDTVKYVPKDFWRQFSKEVKSVKEDFYLLGEVWDPDPRGIEEYTGLGIDGFVNFPLNDDLRQTFVEPDYPMKRLLNNWELAQEYYENPYLMGNFIDNHDMTRFTREVVEKKQYPPTRWKQALAYMYSIPGIPIVYYGSEIALDGGEDPDNRRMMMFGGENEELIQYIEKLAELRTDLPSLRRGDMKVLYEDGGLVAFQRQYEDETVVVVSNNTSETQKITFPVDQFEAGKELSGLLIGDIVREKNGEFNIVLDREETEIYALRDETGLNLPYILSLGAVYASFITFIVLAWRRSKKKKTS
ncbi:alpha-amylase family glycosyl hydrolase [Bacillus fonticola]|uniref:alpha-amylase family glycosyl hydrolase n=1 Tax=Bacillus fonticola TaxID=2728853 RepID=UPI001D158B5F|nr:alpha-amylase family glycosyl hydrolase [Bacillus fonticola]